MAKNKNLTIDRLWQLARIGTPSLAPDGATAVCAVPQWSPAGDQIAFIGRRRQQGTKDKTPQLYLIAPDGGEARRAGTVATGVEAFAWFADGRRIALVSWVWPELRGATAQARRFKAFGERKESGYATSQAQYRFWDHQLPLGREIG